MDLSINNYATPLIYLYLIGLISYQKHTLNYVDKFRFSFNFHFWDLDICCELSSRPRWVQQCYKLLMR